MMADRLVLLVQLPIPPTGPGTIEGNVPLAAACLKLFARRQGLEERYAIELLPAALANTLGDQALIETIVARRPWMVGFTCYVWNVERTLWIAQHLKQRQPDLIVLLGGPEITADNDWVLGSPVVDYAVLGEGEPAFAQLLARLSEQTGTEEVVGKNASASETVLPTTSSVPLSSRTSFALDAVSSPYIEGILDFTAERRMMLETVRGCRFRCKYCYYPKSHKQLRFLSAKEILANLNYAAEHGAAEVVLLDPTLNQRPDFADFLRLLRRGNEGRLALSGELRAEGIDASSARLLREAGFHEVEIGLQSVEPKAWELMGRPADLAAFERGVKAVMTEGIKARVDLILGLPGDTVDSVRRGIEFLQRAGAFSEVQVFNLSILPGTAFRREAKQLGLRYQPWPPYYVLQTPSLAIEDVYSLMEEAQEAFGVEFDALPPPRLDLLDDRNVCRIDLDVAQDEAERKTNSRRPTAGGSDEATAASAQPSDRLPSLAFTLWLRSRDFQRRRQEAAARIDRLLSDNPHTTLQVVLEPTGDLDRLTSDTLELLLATCYKTTTYLDRYYSLQAGRLLGSKRLIVLLPPQSQADESWRRRVSEYATLLTQQAPEVRTVSEQV
jgi:radical SAM superfamily enzyme YgiQ (UPF0313 family)